MESTGIGKRSLNCSAAAVALFVFAQAVPAYAQEQSYSFNIPAQDLGSALRAFARASRQQVTFDARAVRAKRSQALQGSFSARNAIERLLAGSGLIIERGSSGLFIVRAGPQASVSGEAAAGSAAAYDESADIVVTAQKRRERLIDAPQAVTVLTSETLAKMGAVQFRDFARTVPGLSFTTQGAGFTQITLRGVSGSFADVGATVGTYVDDVPFGATSDKVQASQLSLDVGLFDVDRIEVLRGPQGTLYGATAMGGLIKYVTKTPNLTDFGFDMQGGISTTRLGGINYNAAATVNVPLVDDKVAMRASAFESHDGGYIDNLANGRKDVDRADIYGGRVDILLKPTADFSVKISGFLQNISRDGTVTADYTLAGRPIDGNLDQRRAIPESFDQKFRLASGTIAYDLGSATFTSISSYQTIQSAYHVDRSAVFVPLLGFLGSLSGVSVVTEPDTKKFTQELRLASNGGGAFDWLVGGYYTNEKTSRLVTIDIRNTAGQVVPVNLATIAIEAPYKEIAGFGNLTFHFNKKFDVSGGVRYAKNYQAYTQFGSGLLAGNVPKRKAADDVVTYLANARYRFNDRATGYVRYATGYRPGGVNSVLNDPVSGVPTATPTFGADTLQSYEIGLKAENDSRSFSIDTAAYFIDWSNIQIGISENGVGIVGNAPGGATIRGFEVTAIARPSRSLSFVGAFAYQDAKISEADANLGAAKGERLPNVPRFTASIDADYRFEDRGGVRPYFGASLRFVSDRTANFSLNSEPQYRLPDFTTVDLRAGAEIGPVDLQLYVRNVFDVRGQQSVFTASAARGGNGFAPVAISQPRTIGVSLRTRL